MTGSATYDTLGNVLTLTGPGNNATTTITTTLGYTTDGTYSQSEMRGRPITITDNLSHTSHVRYDSQGRATSAWDPVGNTYSATYNIVGQVLNSYAPATGQSGTGQSYSQAVYQYPGGPLTTVKAYNESNTLTRQVTPTYGLEGEELSVSGGPETASWTYDGGYRAISLTDGNSHTTTASFNQSGYVADITYPDTKQITFDTYDATGRLTQSTDTRGTVHTFTYGDAAGALTAISYPSHSSLNVGITRDSYGRVTDVTDGEGEYTASYGDRNEVTAATTTYTGLSMQSFGSTYYPNGSLKETSTPAGNFDCYYDAGGRPTSGTNPFSETTSWTWLDNNGEHTRTLDNGVTTTATYNALHQTTDILTTIGSGMSATTLSEFSNFVHDGAGNLASEDENIAGASSTFFAATASYGSDSHDRTTSESYTSGTSTLASASYSY